MSTVDLTDEQWDDPNLIGMARMYRDTFHDGPCRYDHEGECIGCGRVRGRGRPSRAGRDVDRRQEPIDRRVFDATLPCPDCGNSSVIGFLYLDQFGHHQHTHYVCTFWKSPDDKSVYLRAGYDASKDRCGWHGWSVPDLPTDVGAQIDVTYRQVADEYREAIELARRIVATPLEYGENRMASALVAIDEAMRSELTNDR